MSITDIERETIAEYHRDREQSARRSAPLTPPSWEAEPDGFYSSPGKLATPSETAGPEVSAEGPLPLFPPLPPAAPYPLASLGELSRAAEAIARKVQVPPAIAAQSVLAVAALAAQAHADVLLPFGQTRPLSLYFATVIGSGDRKTSADNEAMRPVAKREALLREDYTDALKEWKVLEAAWGAEKRKIETDKKSGLDERRAHLTTLGDAPVKPLAPLLTMSDLTLDGLTKTWANAHPALGVFTSEGGTFTAGHGMSEENRLRTAAALSEVWDGKPLKRIRALDGVTILCGRRLSMHIMIQPDAASGFLSSRVLRDQGLLSRILVAAPESIAGTRFYRENEASDDAAIAAFGARVCCILEAPAPLADNAPNELAPHSVPLSTGAGAIWRDFFNHVESQSGIAGGLSAIRDFASKAAEHAARLAGVLTIFGNLDAVEIAAPAMENAAMLMNWYLGEAERLQSASRLDPRLLRASALLEWLKGRDNQDFSFRDVLRFGPNAVRTKEVAEDSLGILGAHHWVIETSKRPRAFRLAGGG